MTKNKALTKEEQLFSNIIGYESVKDELLRYCDMIRNPEVYLKLNVRIPRGVLLYGAPGCGKTTIAFDLVNVCDGKLYLLDGGQPDDMFGAELLETFKKVDDSGKRSVIMLDNLNKYGAREHDSKVYELLNDFMPFYTDTSLDEKDCFIIATISSKKMIPDFLYRKNTFEYRVHIGYPSFEDTQKIVWHYSTQYPIASDMNLNDIEKLMFDQSCYDITKVFNTAGRNAGYERRYKITTDDFVKAYIFERDRAIFAEKPDEVCAWHEAGHLVASELMAPGCVSIAYIAGGDGSEGGVVRWQILPTNQLVVSALAGKAACEMQFGMDTDGSSSDLKKARDFLFDEIYETGSYGFLGFEATTEVRDSEHSTFERETIVRAELQRSLLMTQKILNQNREFLEKTAKALLERAYLLNSDIEKIKSTCTIHTIEGV